MKLKKNYMLDIALKYLIKKKEFNKKKEIIIMDVIDKYLIKFSFLIMFFIIVKIMHVMH